MKFKCEEKVNIVFNEISAKKNKLIKEYIDELQKLNQKKEKLYFEADVDKWKLDGKYNLE
jgi:hypothetical protein